MEGKAYNLHSPHTLEENVSKKKGKPVKGLPIFLTENFRPIALLIPE